MKFCLRLILSCLLIFAVANVGVAQDDEYRSEVIVDGLNNPCGVAIQPGTNHLFVSDSGNNRVVRILDGKPQNVITGFPSQTFGRNPEFEIGPLGLLFLDKDTLVVGGGGNADGEELVRVYKVPAAGEEAITADKMESGLVIKSEGSVVGEGDFFGLAKSTKGLYVTCNGDDSKAWIAKADIAGNKVSKLRRHIATKDSTGVNAPNGITFSPEGYLVVSHMGKTRMQADSILAFYNERGDFLDKFPTNLYDVTGIAYGPKKKRLFAIDFCYADNSKGGLYKLIETSEDAGCQAVKIIGLDKPTAMVFDNLGNLYVTVFGSRQTEEEKAAAQRNADQDSREKAKKATGGGIDIDDDEAEETTPEPAGNSEPRFYGKLIKIFDVDKAAK